MAERRSLRQWMLDVHIYLGLLCAGYLVIYGVSTLSFNHPRQWLTPEESRAEWQWEIEMPPAQESDGHWPRRRAMRWGFRAG